ncbi:hypothetical protein [Thioalbus denitrificans]|uniref:Uncharacterized protein n=1 Tax=Thioalbus denitrificans TaxID=547122 RepID=A0A369CC36_9GAMM|nr:hypothetical protein [Thioalbus denitrificans]RCX30705.1 hypothetical protein DFQ59_104141 [Thioalbus denitrificans]
MKGLAGGLLLGLLPALAPAATPPPFNICHGYGCRHQTEIRLTAAEWSSVRGLFRRPPVDAAAERSRIAAAVALLESLAGRRSGTSADRACNSAGSWVRGQQDCIDESTNTATYLHLLDDSGLLRWHRSVGRVRRNPWLFDIHWTAVIGERGSGQRYAVDSWYGANGELPLVAPLELWRRKAASVTPACPAPERGGR